MLRLPLMTLALLGSLTAQAASIATNITVSATGSLGLSGVTVSGPATFTNGIPNGTFSATVTLASLGTSANASVPFTITFSNGTDVLAGNITLPITLLLQGGTANNIPATIDGAASKGAYSGASGSFTLNGQGSLTGVSISLSFAGPGTINTGGSTGGGGTTTQPPVITHVWDAASNTSNIAQGSIFIVQGSNLCPCGTTFYSVPRPTVGTDGVKITFTPTSGGSGTDALLWYEYNPSGVCQLAGILPSTVAVGSYNVTVTNGSASSPFAAAVVQRKFTLFTQDSTGSGLASVQNYISTSRVDLNSFTTGNGKGTTISPAHPGQYLLAYGTGMGALVGGDNAASPAYDFSTNGVTVQAIVGGMTIPVAYAGRAGYAGEDQINIPLPSNVPTGCTVSFQISVNGVLSNGTFIAIAPDANSSACVLPGFTTQQLQSFDQGGTFTTGVFSLSDLSETLSAQQGPVSYGQISGAFTTYTGFQLSGAAAASAYSAAFTAGACQVSVSNPATTQAIVTTTGGTALDAGVVALSGPSGSNLTNVALTETSNSYEAIIGTSLGIPGSVNGSIVAGAYSLSGAGGKDVKPFSASVTLGTPLTITNGLPASVTRSAGLTLNWTGGNSTDIVRIFGSSSPSATSANAASFFCLTTAGQKTFTVPAAILQQLPATGSGAGLGSLSVESGPSPGAFQATLVNGKSIDLGLFLAFTGISASATYQ